MIVKQFKFNVVKKAFVLFLLLIGNLFAASAQSSYDIRLGWHNQVLCAVYDDGDHEKIELTEELEMTECLKICHGMIADYWIAGTDANLVSAVNWSVTGGDFTLGNGGQEITVDWNNINGTGTIFLSLTLADGTVLHNSICVEPLESPKANFSTSNLEDDYLCLDQEVYFNNLSIPNPGGQLVAFEWNFGDGTTSSEYEPVHSYANPGSYTVELKVWNECNCFNVYKTKVVVKDMGVPPEISCPTVTCENNVESYEAISGMGCDNFDWIVEGGTILSGQGTANVVVKWDNVDQETGFGWIYVKDCSPCPVPAQAKVPVVLNKVEISGNNSICLGEQNRYSIPKWPTTEVDWTLTDVGGNDFSQFLVLSNQRNEILIDSDANLPGGDYVLSAVYRNTLKKCSGRGEIKLEILESSHEIEGPKQACEGDHVEYSTLEPDNNITWVLKDENGNQIYSFYGLNFSYAIANAGEYTLTANSPNRCSGKAITILIQNPPAIPQGIFDIPEVVCPGLAYDIEFTNTDPNINTSDFILEWRAINGEINGSTTNEQSSVIFDVNPSGDYQVEVRYVMSANPYCPSAWQSSNIILPESVDTEIESFDPDSGSALSNNTFCTSTEANFRVDDLEGDKYIWSVSPANFASIVSGQNTPEIALNIHEISSTDVGFLQLQIEKCGELFTVDSFEINKLEAPTVSWTDLDSVMCAEDSFSISFSADIGTQPVGNFDQAILDLGDGQVFTSPASTGAFHWAFHNLTFDNVFQSNVNYNISLTLQGPESCQDVTVYQQVTIIPTPVAAISSNESQVTFCEEADIPSNYVLTGIEQGGLVNVSSWKWERNGSTVQNTSSPNLTVSQFGNYRVTAVGENGCSGESSTYTIYQMGCGPSGSCNETFSIDNTSWTNCNTVEVDFSYSSIPNNINWNIQPADGMSYISTSGTTATFEVTKPGSYSITGRAHYNCGTKRDEELVQVDYQVDLDYEISCNPLFGGYDLVIYNNSPFIPNFQPDQTIFTVNNNSVTFNNHEDSYTTSLPSGIHTFQLGIKRGNNPICNSQVITINMEDPSANFTIPSEICTEEPLLLTPNNPDPNLDYSWIFNNEVDYRDELLVNLSEGQLVQVVLRAENEEGCIAEFLQLIDVNRASFNGNITGDEGPYCLGDVATLTYNQGSGDQISSYQWFRNNNILNGETNPSIQTNISGVYSLELIDINGCTSNINPPSVKLNFNEAQEIFISGPSQFCEGDEFKIEGYIPNYQNIEYRWLRNGNVLENWQTATSSTVAVEGVFDNNGIFTFTLETNEVCETNQDFVVEVFDVPEIDEVVVQGQVICDPFEVNLSVVNPDPLGTYSWSNGDGGVDTIINRSGVVGLTYTNSNGCSVTKEIEIPQLPKEHLWVLPTGCIEKCERLKSDKYIIGPIPEFDYYAWDWDGYPNSGSGIVTDEYINNFGELSLILSQTIFEENCDFEKSSLNVIPAEEGCHPCDVEIGIEQIDIEKNLSTFFYRIHVQINNPFSSYVNIELDSTDGVYVPSTISLAPGQAQVFVIDFIPNSSFNGGSSNLSYQVYLNGTKLACTDLLNMHYPMLPQPMPTSSIDENDSNYSFILTPNPTTSSVNANYNFNSGNSGIIDGRVSLYTLTGMKIKEFQLKKPNGNLNIDVSAFSSGTYLVVIEDGRGFKQQQLLIKE